VAFELPPLPYAEDALEPAYSARTISFHYGKPPKTYVDTLNTLPEGTELAGRPLEDVIRAVAGDASKVPVVTNAAPVWNHTVFGNCMKPGGGGAPPAGVAARLDAAFGGYEGLVDKFKAAAVGRFGSGWAWIVLDDKGVPAITSTPNAETPLTAGSKPLLVVAVWAHAYYLDYQNRRPDWVQAFFDKLVNWDFVAKNLG